MYTYIHADIHTHTHIYIYIYILIQVEDIIPTFRQAEVSKFCFKDVFRSVSPATNSAANLSRAAELASTAGGGTGGANCELT